MNESEKVNDFFGIFGYTPWPRLDTVRRPIDREIEPWMLEFVKERHPQESWDAFYDYFHSGPLRRVAMAVLWVLRPRFRDTLRGI